MAVSSTSISPTLSNWICRVDRIASLCLTAAAARTSRKTTIRKPTRKETSSSLKKTRSTASGPIAPTAKAMKAGSTAE